MDLEALMGFINGLPILLLLPFESIVSEVPEHSSVEKKPRTTCSIGNRDWFDESHSGLKQPSAGFDHIYRLKPKDAFITRWLLWGLM